MSIRHSPIDSFRLSTSLALMDRPCGKAEKRRKGKIGLMISLLGTAEIERGGLAKNVQRKEQKW